MAPKGGTLMGRIKSEHLPIFLSYLLRHASQEAGLDMDSHGWVSATQLIQGINATGRYQLDRETLEEIVATDDKGRFCFSEDGQRIKACQGHSIPWVHPDLELLPPPAISVPRNHYCGHGKDFSKRGDQEDVPTCRPPTSRYQKGLAIGGTLERGDPSGAED